MVGWCSILAIVIIGQRVTELYIAEKNRRWSLEAGAKEFGAGHYPLFFILHSSWLIGWISEAIFRGSVSGYWYVWFSLFAMAQGLRYWCMASLGRHWNTRILVIPGKEAVLKGPYRFFAHPNYVAVAIELVSAPLIFGAVYTAIAATFFNTALILGIRLPKEKNALQLLKRTEI